MIDPFSAIAEFGIGLIRSGHIQGWCRLAASILASAFVTFFGVFGLTLEAQLHLGISASIALPLSLAHATTLMALAVLGLWLKSPLTKGIPVLYPGKIEAARLQELADDGTVYSENKR